MNLLDMLPLSTGESHDDPGRNLRILVPQLMLALLILLTAAAFVLTVEDQVRWAWLWTGLALVVATIVAAVATLWTGTERWWVITIPLADIMALGILRVALLPDGISLSMFVFVPAMWLALIFRRRGLCLAVLTTVLSVSIPSLIFIPPYSTPSSVLRNAILPIAVGLVGWFALLLYEQLVLSLRELLEAQEQKETVYREAQSQARLLMGVGLSLNVGVRVFDAQGRPTMSNVAQDELEARMCAPEDIGHPPEVDDVYAADGRTRLPCEQRPGSRAIRGEIFENVRVVVGPPGGDQRTLSVASRQVVSECGELESTVVMSYDITELQEAVDERNKFVATVSHELRTPLTSILGYADLAAEETDGSPVMDEYLSVIQRNSQHLLSLVEELLQEQQVRMGESGCHPERLRVAELVSAAVESQQPQAHGKQQTLTAHVEVDTPPIWSEPSRIMQVISNLITNALKYTPPGGAVDVTTHTGSGSVGFTVTDDGPGMEADDAAKIFSPFYRTRSATRSSAGGVGLGLSICRAIVEAHGGHIAVTTAPGAGTSIFVSLPLSAEQEAA